MRRRPNRERRTLILAVACAFNVVGFLYVVRPQLAQWSLLVLGQERTARIVDRKPDGIISCVLTFAAVDHGVTFVGIQEMGRSRCNQVALNSEVPLRTLKVGPVLVERLAAALESPSTAALMALMLLLWWMGIVALGWEAVWLPHRQRRLVKEGRLSAGQLTDVKLAFVPSALQQRYWIWYRFQPSPEQAPVAGSMSLAHEDFEQIAAQPELRVLWQADRPEVNCLYEGTAWEVDAGPARRDSNG